MLKRSPAKGSKFHLGPTGEILRFFTLLHLIKTAIPSACAPACRSRHGFLSSLRYHTPTSFQSGSVSLAHQNRLIVDRYLFLLKIHESTNPRIRTSKNPHIIRTSKNQKIHTSKTAIPSAYAVPSLVALSHAALLSVGIGQSSIASASRSVKESTATLFFTKLHHLQLSSPQPS